MAGESFKKRCVYLACPDWFWDTRPGRVKAFSAGWFEQKNGDVWCPAHLPDWVIDWRNNKKKS